MTLSAGFIAELERIAPVKRDEPLGRHTTFGVGGPADAFAIASNAEQIAAMVRLCRNSETAFFVLGSGSNIVIGDKGIRGVTIGNQAAEHTQLQSVLNGEQRFLVRADAGSSFAGLARHLAKFADVLITAIAGSVYYASAIFVRQLGNKIDQAA